MTQSAATKGYDTILAEGLWYEMKQYGVDVMACVAGGIATPNYVEDTPNRIGWLPRPMPPSEVAAETLSAFGRTPSFIPGRAYRAIAFLLARLAPRSAAIRLMATVNRRLHSPGGAVDKRGPVGHARS
jgi:short-subunit dehydrogenase